MHIRQGVEMQAGDKPVPTGPLHPIELFARAYGIAGPWSEGVGEPNLVIPAPAGTEAEAKSKSSELPVSSIPSG
jgi:hypothetical protein